MKSLFTKLAPALLRITINTWLKDYELIKNLGIEATGFLQSKLESVATGRETQRFFETAVDRMVEHLRKSIDVEFSNVTPNGRDRVVEALSEDIQEHTSIDHIINHNFNWQQLLQSIRNEGTLEKYDLSLQERDLYDYILSECSQYVCEFVKTLPEFSAQALKGIINQQAVILKRLDHIVQMLPAERQDVNSPDPFANQYKNAVLSKWGQMQIHGLNLQNLPPRYPLDIAYVSLQAEALKGQSDREDNSESDQLKVEDFLSVGSVFCIVGEAGSGKTTLLQWVATNAVASSFPKQLRHWNKRIPFLIQLRHYPHGNFPRPKDFLRTNFPNLNEDVPDKWILNTLKSGNVIILIDGLDEVPVEVRGKALKWLSDLLQDFPKIGAVITSRPLRLNFKQVDHKIKVAHLQRMGLDDIHHFINHWHRAAATLLIDESDMERLETSRLAITSKVVENSSIRSLSTTPLMCGLICALNFDRQQNLPKDRHELYRVAIELLLDRRDPEREILVYNSIKLSREDKEFILQDLAHWLAINEKTTIRKEQFQKRVETSLSVLRRQEISSKETTEYLTERSGLIREATLGQLDFIHKTFQEFLAGKHFILEDNIGILLKNAANEAWQEIIILAAACTNKPQADELINGLLNLAVRAKSVERMRQFNILALSCREHARIVSLETNARADQALQLILPPTTVYEARALADAGLPLAEFLPRFADADVSIATLCLNTLIESGDPSFFPAIAKFAHRKETDILAEFYRGWRYFDSYQYGKQVISKTRAGGLLRWQDRRSASSLRFARHITWLEISNCEAMTNLEFMKGKSDCIGLVIKKCSDLASLNGLQDLTQLKELVISDCGALTDISALGGLTKLRKLALANCQAISQDSFSIISNLPNLRDLDLHGNYNVSNLKFLERSERLEVLNLDACYGVTSLDCLSGLWKLHELHVATMSLIDDLPEEMQIKLEVW